MAKYLFDKVVNIDLINEQIKSSSSFDTAVYQGLSSDGSSIVVYFENDLDAGQESDLNNIVNAHDAEGVSEAEKSYDHLSFGREFFDRWNQKFIEQRYLESDLSYEVAGGLATIYGYVQIGNLYAVDEMLAGATPEAEFVTAEVIREMRNEVRGFLGLELI